MRWIEARVDVRDLGHIAELHQPVGGEDLVGGGLTEPGEAAAGDLEGEQALVAVGDVALGLGVDLGREFLGALHVVEREDVGVGAGGGLLEAAAGHAEDAVHAFDDLAERAGIEADEDAGGVGDGASREVEIVLGGVLEAAVEDEVLLAAVGDDFDLADDDVVDGLRPALWAESVSLNLPMRLALMVNCEPPTRPDSTATDFSAVSLSRENQSSDRELA